MNFDGWVRAMELAERERKQRVVAERQALLLALLAVVAMVLALLVTTGVV
jgi:CHASE3 domain sensor protein